LKPHLPGIRLAVTLHYLTTGDTHNTMSHIFQTNSANIPNTVRMVVEAIIQEYTDEVIQFPKTPDEWRAIAQGFGDRWNFWHALGAMDGKHVAIKTPTHSVADYRNYMRFCSIILMAMVDADYKFFWVDVGMPGSAGYAQIFNRSQLGQFMEAGRAPIPPDDELPGDDRPTRYFIIGDDAFALKGWLLKPYGGRLLEPAETDYLGRGGSLKMPLASWRIDGGA
jgi:hypothetical protein